MSDADEEFAPPPQAPTETIRMGGVKLDKEALAAGIEKGNISITSHVGGAETIKLTEASRQAHAVQREVLEGIDLQRRMRQMVVPTADAEVRNMLRSIGEPITLFGEREMERRERLRRLMASDEGVQEKLARHVDEMIMEEVVLQPKEKFYTEGPTELRAARLAIAKYSLVRAAERICVAKRKREDADGELRAAEAAVALAKTLTQQVSEVGDDRPLSDCAFTSDGALLATGSWSGLVKIWKVPDCTLAASMRVGDTRVTGVAWHPQASLEPGVLALAAGCADRRAVLLSADGVSLATLEGHTDRLARLAFHPMGTHLATASYDGVWRLWDAGTGQCLAEQEGHSRAVYAVAFHGDGSLAASGGLDAVGRIWDMRTGRCIFTLQGHIKGVLSMDFSPNGYTMATGAEDNTARVWDLRQRACLYTLPGHTSLVSQVRYEPSGGHVLATSGFDNTAKLWNMRDFTLLRTLAGHEGKVMGCDVAGNGGLLATVSFDRTLKLWAPDEFATEDAMVQ